MIGCQRLKKGGSGGRVGMAIKEPVKDPCGDKNVLYLNVSISICWLRCCFARLTETV